MTGGVLLRRARGCCLALTLACVTGSALADGVAGTPPTVSHSRDEYAFQLGGFSGHFTQWEQRNIERFAGLTATVRIDELMGGEGDRWASIARISFWAKGSTETQPAWSIVFEGDRETKRIRPYVLLGEEAYTIESAFELKQAVQLKLMVKSGGGFELSLDDTIFEPPGDIDVGRIQVLGSGLEATMDPFVIERRAE